MSLHLYILECRIEEGGKTRTLGAYQRRGSNFWTTYEIIFFVNNELFFMGLNIAKYLIKAKLQHPNPKLHTTAITYAKNNKVLRFFFFEILKFRL